ncbi:MAG TPA: tetratricopeptide repeat protein [Candidatus Paceibacterota bacterium]|nr:tetratricopeptide repeat protein [Candidatus Paceibacterota bacterium]
MPKIDKVDISLRTVAYNMLAVVFGFLPLVFLPISKAPFEYTKALLVIGTLCVALVLFSLSVLRTGILRIGISYPLVMLWMITAITFASSMLSGDFFDSFVGDYFSIHSSVFVALIAFISTTWLILRPTKAITVRLFLFLALSTVVLSVYHITRLITGADIMSFGVFNDITSSPLGSWNDLALFLGLTVILSLVALEQLTLSRLGKVFFAFVSVLSVTLLAVINFFFVWIVIGLTSLALVLYSLGKERFAGAQLSLIRTQSTNTVSLFTSLGIFAVSILFIIGGASLGAWVAQYTDVSYIEVRPTLEATSDIARGVYVDKAFLGIGPNKFVDAWRLHKDPSINATPFWNTDFNAGSGYIPTFFVTTGVFGGISWVLFVLVYVITGLQRLLRSTKQDKVWYFIAVSSFVGATYIWGMSFTYVPGMVVLILGALLTGISIHAFSELSTESGKYISIGNNRQLGFLLTFGVVIVIIGSVSIMYLSTRQYASLYTFNGSVQSMESGKSIDELEREVLSALSLASNDLFARRIAEYQLARLNTLSVVQEPNDEQKQEFNSAMVNGVRFAREATRIDPQDPANWAVLAGVYSILASLNIEGAHELATEAFTKYRELNPKNPLPHLELAVVEVRKGDYEKARSYINDAIALKPDFTEAYYLLTQLEISKGDIEKAIDSAKATIALDPQNPVRYYQLGVLESARNDVDATISAFETAVTLDPQYANARYLLALAYDIKGRSQDALTQLQKVYELNPDNTEVANLIEILTTQGSLANLRTQPQQVVQEQTPSTGQSGEVNTTIPPDTSLVTPVNTPPKESDVEAPPTE